LEQNRDLSSVFFSGIFISAWKPPEKRSHATGEPVYMEKLENTLKKGRVERVKIY
jgi:hypothetical protein